MLIALVILATIAAHRIWHYEDIFAPVRSSLGAKVLIDPTVTPLWIAGILASVAIIPHPLAPLALTALATYPFLRGAVWLYTKYEHPAAKCSPCAAKQQAGIALQKELRKWEKRIITVGVKMTPDIVKLAKDNPKWLFIFVASVGDKEWQDKNIMHRPIIDKSQDMTLNNLMNIVLHGGSATFVLHNVATDPQWRFVVGRIGMMKAVAWVHTGVIDGSGPPLPAHHRRVAHGDIFDKVIADASPPA